VKEDRRASADPSLPAVLIVDDVEANLVALEAVLENMDCEVVRASSGNEALLKLLHRDFAVVLLDVQMPEMDGYEVALHAGKNPRTREVPIIFLTAATNAEENVLRGYGSGAVDFLFKPLNPVILLGKVQVFLDLYRARVQIAGTNAALEKTIAELTALAETKAALAEELEHKNRELEAFSYSVSHDLRAPLRAIEGFSQVLLADYSERLDEQARDYLERVRAAAQRMALLIDDLLNLSKIARTPLVRQRLNVSEIGRAVLGELRAGEPERTVECIVPDGLVAHADPRLFRVVLDNLLGNAWKFTSKQPLARIELGQERREGDGVFFVRDNGAGFDMAYATKLFAPFQRLHSNQDFEGTGIGLALVSRIVSRHGGRVWAEAAPGNGATFFFSLGARG
jgi:two-component system, sensor histidine kinase and response regulator